MATCLLRVVWVMVARSTDVFLESWNGMPPLAKTGIPALGYAEGFVRRAGMSTATCCVAYPVTCLVFIDTAGHYERAVRGGPRPSVTWIVNDGTAGATGADDRRAWLRAESAHHKKEEGGRDAHASMTPLEGQFGHLLLVRVAGLVSLRAAQIEPT